jgi:hypothetical protein
MIGRAAPCICRINGNVNVKSGHSVNGVETIGDSFPDGVGALSCGKGSDPGFVLTIS